MDFRKAAARARDAMREQAASARQAPGPPRASRR